MKYITPIAIALVIIFPLALDFYIPALPTIISTLGEPAAYSIATFLLGSALGQLFFGKASDRFGRKPIAITGLLVFSIASFILSRVQGFETLLIFRFIQGVGAAATSVTAFALISDHYQGKEAAKQFGILLGGLNIVPALAPILGSSLLKICEWPVLFVILGGIASITSIVLFCYFPSSPSLNSNNSNENVGMLTAYSPFLTPGFLVNGATCCIFLGIILGYVAIASPVLITRMDTTQIVFSLLFSLNAAGIMLFNFLTPKLLTKYSAFQMIVSGLALGILGSLLLAMNIFQKNAWSFMIPIMLISIGFALSIGSANARAMENCRHKAGTGAALLGCGQMLSGALISSTVFALPLPLQTNLGIIALLLLTGILYAQIKYESTEARFDSSATTA